VGEGWDPGGCGWLPYEYVLKGLAVDWWSLVKSEWIDPGAFEL
jgi:C1A family cysteine protease